MIYTRPILLFFFFFVSIISFSQEVMRIPLTRKLTLANGLSSFNIRKIVQDRYGFIWIATQEGLNRYDGRQFTLYTNGSKTKHQLLGSDVWSMAEDSSRNSLWVITAYGGLNAIDLQTGIVTRAIKIIIGADAFPNDWLRCVAVCGGKIWIGTSDGLCIYDPDKNSFTRMEPLPFLKDIKFPFTIDNLYVDIFSNIWTFIGNYGVVIYSGITGKVINKIIYSELQLEMNPDPRQFYNILEVSDNSLLAGTRFGFRQIHYDVKYHFTIRKGLPSGLLVNSPLAVKGSGIDRKGQLWFSSGGALFKTDPQFQNITRLEDATGRIEGDWLSSIYTFCFDEQDNIWMGTQNGVIYMHNSKPAFVPYSESKDQKARIDHPYYLYPDNDSVLYICGTDNFQEFNLRNSSIRVIDKGKLFYFFTRLHNSTAFVSNDNGTYIYQPPGKLLPLESQFSELAALGKETINSIVFANDSIILFGSETASGYFKWNVSQHYLKLIVPDLPESIVKKNGLNTLYKDGQGFTWVLFDNSISIYDAVKGTSKDFQITNPEKNLPLSIFFDMCEARGDYWIAAYGTGIVQLDRDHQIKKIFSLADGLNNTGIYKIFSIGDSSLYFTTNNGLSVLNLNSKKIKTYLEIDGLHSNSFEESVGIYKNDLIYAGGIGGFTIVSPKDIFFNKYKPEIYVSNIQVKMLDGEFDTSNLLLQSVSIPQNYTQVTVSFSAINFVAPEKTVFYYKINEISNEWINLGAQNFVNLIGLKPGNYSFQLKAANEEGIMSEVKTIMLEFHPKWFQTRSFKILLILLGAAIVYAIYKARINQLKKEKEIRTHLASDLHDDLGSTLNSVKVYANMAMIEKENSRYLEKIKESTQEAITGVRDIIWILDDKKDSLDDLLTRISLFAAPVCDAAHISFHSQLSDSLRNYKLGKEEKRNLYMIIKEAVNNSVKYAKGSSIRVIIDTKEARVAIKVADDGIGFEIGKVVEGNGLKNIMRRSTEIGYQASIHSAPGVGTTIQLIKN